MSPDPMEYAPSTQFVPPSYEQCVAAPAGMRSEYVATPLAMAALFAWDDD